MSSANDPASTNDDRQTDCLIIGGGPAGLTAAIYLARFHLAVAVVDAGRSRAKLIPLTRNHAGFPDGISGPDLLARMRRQADLYGASMIEATVEALSQHEQDFVATFGDASTFRARTVLLATGVVNRRPPMIDERTHSQALASGQLRYCPICDGYEVTDKRVAVMGTGQRGCDEALFLRTYTADVTLVAPRCDHSLTPEQRETLTDAGVGLAAGCEAIRLDGQKVVLDLKDHAVQFDSLYPALGSDIRSELAGQLGAARSEEGCLTVDAHQRTNVPGLYAAGDVVLGLDQISHAMGEGGVAATTIRNDLARQTPLRR
ncbi:NAD(P)/FAD-dependent oxidoreductase [Novosphingobium sp. G106]|uniref:NAD(P)/FAD-dependent oxidoreductase n=1 Tax=Novosphingobium sp. G106 TaxID=2849500 RepID=UPI001C2D6311|nr:NAD(P)/FAD-dependent oxidoreductase [Novosphingobium sp. G106]MBV1688477.1 NAD(P)/FAD-dependent oxidoreductase [Novosphingobium sp. G106]